MKHKSAFFLIYCLCPTTALATIQLAPVIVSEKPSTVPSFNTEPVSKNEFYQQELIERGIRNLDNITRQIANLHITNEGIGSYAQRVSLRGLVNTALFSIPTVPIYVDDVPYSNVLTTIGNLFGIDSLDVYRSSQPGRFGKNAYAGAMNIKTRQPENDLHAGVALELGNYNQHQVTANASGALVKDHLYFNLNGQFQEREGFLFNSYLNTTPDNLSSFSGRAALKWTPNQAWDVRLLLTKENFDYGANRLVRLDSPDFYTVRSEANEKLKQQADSEAIRIAYHGDDYELLSVSGRRFWQMSPRVVDLNLLPTVFTRTQNSVETAWTQEFRLSPKDQHNTWNWQTGLFYSNVEKHATLDTLLLNTNTRIALNKHITDSYAVFGQLAYQDFKQIKPYLDLRVDYVKTAVNGANTFPNGRTISLQQRDGSFFVSPKFGIDVTLSDNALLYASTGLAFKPAGFTIANINENLSHYKQERLWNNELGIKSQWFNDRFKLNLAGFYYDIENYQVERFFTLTDYAIVNAPRAHNYGFEVESQAQLMENLTLEGNFGYTHSQFDQYRDPVTRVNYAGNAIPFVPEFTGLLALQYKHPQGYFARFEGMWTGKTYFDEINTDIMQQKAYSIANVRLGYEQKNYSVYVFAKNITDTRYYTFKIDSLRGTPSAPRMVGVRLAVNF
jgi:iron complex outermembrane receptor protein